MTSLGQVSESTNYRPIGGESRYFERDVGMTASPQVNGHFQR
jgi:hypothetical protein